MERTRGGSFLAPCRSLHAHAARFGEALLVKTMEFEETG
jgi:hypothetical protein